MSILLAVTLLGMLVGVFVPLVWSEEGRIWKAVIGGLIGLLAGAGIGFAFFYLAASILLRR